MEFFKIKFDLAHGLKIRSQVNFLTKFSVKLVQTR